MNLKMNAPYIIAEIGNNHEGIFENAIKLIDAAKLSGANAAKFQTFVPKLFHDKADKDRQATLERFQLSFDEFDQLAKYTKETGLDFISTPLDLESLSFLAPLVDAIKISSGDLVWLDLIEQASKFDKPLIISTGASSNDEVKKSLHIAYQNKDNNAISVLHCTSEYPAELENSNMKQILKLKDIHTGPIGFSDHTKSNAPAILALSMGATIFEKHITLDNNFSNFRDHQVALNPIDFSEYVDSLHHANLCLGSLECSKEEAKIQKVIRRSPRAKHNLKKGESVSSKDFYWTRPQVSDVPYDFFYKGHEFILNEDINADDIVLINNFTIKS